MNKNVYIIEDNEKNMKLFRAILKLIPGISIFEEIRGDSGLELIKNGDPDLVILDIQLPEISGIEICNELRKMEKFDSVPIIAVTSFAMKGDKDRMHLYFELSNGAWYYFFYRTGLLQVVSSNVEFNKVIREMKDDEKKLKTKRSEAKYSFTSCSEQKKNAFLENF